jgi:monoamine oxidase
MIKNVKLQKFKTDIVIIGAGLTGLTLAYLLKKRGIEFIILEARNRLGGRILTDYQEKGAPIEKGATWLGRKHQYLFRLLQELNIDTFRQELGDTAIYEPISTSPHQIVQLPPNNDPSYRVAGGTSTIIDSLSNSIDADRLLLNQVASKIKDDGEHLNVMTQDTSYTTRIVVSTLPPNLLVSSIAFQPGLPESLESLARNTHTWMGESIKIGLSFDKPFWRHQNSSGTIFSNVGPIPEMYDHSDYTDSTYALKGFLNSSYYSITKEERKNLVLNQLQKYYGKAVNRFLSYEEMVWRNEKFTFSSYNSHILPHQNNGHPIFTNKFLNGKLIIGGSETAREYPGYMEGAVRSAKFILAQILEST